MLASISRMGPTITPDNLNRVMKVYRALIISYEGRPMKIFEARQGMRDFLRTTGMEDAEIENMLEHWEFEVDLWST